MTDDLDLLSGEMTVGQANELLTAFGDVIAARLRAMERRPGRVNCLEIVASDGTSVLVMLKDDRREGTVE